MNTNIKLIILVVFIIVAIVMRKYFRNFFSGIKLLGLGLFDEKAKIVRYE